MRGADARGVERRPERGDARVRAEQREVVKVLRAAHLVRVTARARARVGVKVRTREPYISLYLPISRTATRSTVPPSTGPELGERPR